GVCAIDGCVPMHAMLAGANSFQSCQKAGEFGFTFQPCGVNFTAFMHKVRAITEQGLGDPFSDEEKVTLYSGKASFVSPHELKIRNAHGEERIISGEQIVIATGAKPNVPDITGLKDIDYWQYQDVTHAETLPASL